MCVGVWKSLTNRRFFHLFISDEMQRDDIDHHKKDVFLRHPFFEFNQESFPFHFRNSFFSFCSYFVCRRFSHVLCHFLSL